MSHKNFAFLLFARMSLRATEGSAAISSAAGNLRLFCRFRTFVLTLLAMTFVMSPLGLAASGERTNFLSRCYIRYSDCTPSHTAFPYTRCSSESRSAYMFWLAK